METEKIILTDEEKQVIENQLNGGVGYDPETEEEKRIMSAVIDKADALMRKLDAWDELDGDLIGWYYNKYKEQFITA